MSREIYRKAVDPVHRTHPHVITMSLFNYVSCFLVSHILAVYYSAQVLLVFVINYIKNPFSNPWSVKLKLEQPSRLTDPKYGVHKYIKVNNVNLHYVESGDPCKPLMIFVHGFPEFWYSWRYQLTEFQKDYWCIAVDMRGYGDSERPGDVTDYKIEILVEDLKALILELGHKKCILVAHDWGGAIAIKLLDTYPDLLNALIIMASCSIEALYHALLTDADQRKKSWYMFFFKMPALAEYFLKMNDLEIFDKIMLVPGKDTVEKEDIECYKYWFRRQHTLTPPVNYYRANFRYSWPEKQYNGANVPFLLAYAENDIFLTKSVISQTKKEYPHLETVFLEGCMHFLHQEEPIFVNRMMKNFLIQYRL